MLNFRLEAAVTLVAKGQPASVIVLAERPTQSAQLAAREIQCHIKLITGAELPIVAENEPIPSDKLPLHVGESKATRAMGLTNSNFGKQEHLVRITNQQVVLIGHDAERYAPITYEQTGAWTGLNFHSPEFQVGTLYAVYDFLERECGVRWYMVSDLGAVYANCSTLSCEPAERRVLPSAKLRLIGTPGWAAPGAFGKPDGMGYLRTSSYANGRDSLLHALRTRYNGSSMFQNAHALLLYNKLYAQTHPDWFVGGSPGTDVQLRFWKDEVVDQVSQDAIDFFNLSPEQRNQGGLKGANKLQGLGDMISLGPLDNRIFGLDCQPPLQPERKRPNTFMDGIASDYWFTFVNKVARRAGKAHPDKWIVSPAYASHFEPPTFGVEPNVAISMANTEGWTDGSYGVENIKAWTKKVKRLTTYEYWYSQGGLPAVRPHEVAAYIKLLCGLGVEGMSMEMISGSNPAVYHLDYYITMRALFDGSVNVDDILREYFARFYGPAEKPMQQFWGLLEEKYQKQPDRGKGDKNEQWVAFEVSGGLKRADTVLKEAEALAQEEPFASRVKIMRTGVYDELAYNVALAKRIIATPLPVVSVRKTSLKPTVDGKLDDPIWQGATATEPFVICPNWRLPVTTDALPTSKDHAKVAWDGDTLYLAVVVDQPNMDKLVLAQTHPSPGVCTDDSIEVVIDVGHRKDKADYLHFQMNANNVFWLQWTRYGWCKPVPVELGIQGKADKGTNQWTAEFAIPLKLLTDNKLPQPGQEWGLNIYCNKPAGGGSTAWSRTFGMWHVINRFGAVKFSQ